MRLPAFLVVSALLTLSAPATAQSRVVELAPGDSVQLVWQRVFDRGPALRVAQKRLDVGYTTTIPASSAEQRLAQADRAAEFFGSEAERVGARRLSIGICDTRECAERRHPPSEWHLYERRRDGWRRVDPSGLR